MTSLPSQENAPDPRGTRLQASTSILDARSPWLALLLYAAGVGLWIKLAEELGTWMLGGVLAGIVGISLLLWLRRWLHARPLRARLGELDLRVRPQPAQIGAALEIQVALEVRAPIRLASLTLDLHCDAARIETYGIQSRERRVWTCAFQAEVLRLPGAAHEAGEAVTAHADVSIPPDQFPTSQWTHWWIVLSATIEGCPAYEVSFALEVAKGADTP